MAKMTPAARSAKRRNAKRRLLACFDESGDAGEFGVGLVDGALMDAEEIPEVLERARLAWVQSMRATGKSRRPLRGLGKRNGVSGVTSTLLAVSMSTNMTATKMLSMTSRRTPMCFGTLGRTFCRMPSKAVARSVERLAKTSHTAGFPLRPPINIGGRKTRERSSKSSGQNCEACC